MTRSGAAFRFVIIAGMLCPLAACAASPTLAPDDATLTPTAEATSSLQTAPAQTTPSITETPSIKGPTPTLSTVPEAESTVLNPDQQNLEPDIAAQVSWVGGGGGIGCGVLGEQEGLFIETPFNYDTNIVSIPDPVTWVIFYGTAVNRSDVQFEVTYPNGTVSPAPEAWITRVDSFCWELVMPTKPGMQLGKYTFKVIGDQTASVDLIIALPDMPEMEYYDDTNLWIAGYQPYETIRLIMYLPLPDAPSAEFAGYQELVMDEYGMAIVDVSTLPEDAIFIAQGASGRADNLAITRALIP